MSTSPAVGRARSDTTPETVPELVRRSFRTYGTAPALRIRRGTEWHVTSYSSAADRTEAIAAGLAGIGVEPGDRVAVLARNSPEWTLADIGIMTAAAVTVPIYATSTPEQVAFVLADSGATAAFVGAGLLPLVAEVRDRCPALEHVIVLPEAGPTGFTDGDSQTGSAREAGAGSDDVTARLRPGLHDLSELEAAATPVDHEGLARRTALVEERLGCLTRDSLCALIYTSGTTGEPKGVMLTHGNLLHQGREISARFPLRPGERNMCFLPLSHAYERAWTLVIVLAHGLENVYVADPKKVVQELREIAPQTFVSVPRLYEKVYDAAVRNAGDGVKRDLFDWALDVGVAVNRRRARGQRVSARLRAQHRIADRLVFSKIREAIGGHKRVMAAGGAPLRTEVEEFFFAIGETVYNGYGLTETAPVVSCNCPAAIRFGTVGTVLPGCQVRIGSDGEIFVRGENVMAGYWNRPEETAAVLDDGWFRTGDVGRLDGHGFLLITDRVKDLIVTAQGKNIAPAPIEGALTADPLVELAFVVGDGRPYLTALLQPEFGALAELARDRGWVDAGEASREALVRHPEVLGYYRAVVERVDRQLARHEQVKRFRLLGQELTLDDGSLTPTLKMRRKTIHTRYADLIEEMYAVP